MVNIDEIFMQEALRQAKRAMRLGSELDLEAGLEIEDNCWRQAALPMSKG